MPGSTSAILSTTEPKDKLWRKHTLIALWVLQVLLSTALIGIITFWMSVYIAVAKAGNDDPGQSLEFRLFVAYAVISIAACIFTLACALVEMNRFARGKLSPALAVTLGVILTLIWLFPFFQSFVNLVVYKQGAWTLAFCIVVCLLFATLFLKLIYASKILHRYRMKRYSVYDV